MGEEGGMWNSICAGGVGQAFGSGLRRLMVGWLLKLLTSLLNGSVYWHVSSRVCAICHRSSPYMPCTHRCNFITLHVCLLCLTLHVPHMSLCGQRPVREDVLVCGCSVACVSCTGRLLADTSHSYGLPRLVSPTFEPGTAGGRLGTGDYEVHY